MRKLVVFFVVCLFGLAGFSQSVMARQGLSANLYAVDNGVAFELTNTGDSPISILRWETPFEDELTQDIFAVVPSSNGKVSRFGQRAQYSGRVLKRGKPGLDDYLVLKPGETASTEVALGEYYQLASDGLHTAQFTGSFVLESLSFGKRTVHSHSQRDPKAGGIETEAVAVHLTAPPKAAFAVAGGFNSCSADQQAQLPADLDASEEITLAALAAMQNLPANERAASPRYLHWFGTYSEQRFNSVADTYQKASDRMADGSVEFNCDCDENFFAYVFPIDPFKVYLCNAYWQADRFGTDSRAGTILHELSHFPEVAGTRDFAYGAVTVANLALSNPANAVNNADSIEYFAENTPFREISAGEGETAAPQLVNFQVLQPGVGVSGSLATSESAYFEVSGADFVELTTVSGDADLFIYSTAARDNLLCRSETTGNIDRCEISSASTAYIEVFGFRESTFSIVAAPSAPAVSQQLVPGETLTRSVGRGEDEYFVVSGADIVEIESLSGDADLYVHSDAQRTEQTCSSLAFSQDSVYDSCELSGGTSYITVHGFTNADFTVLARTIATVLVETDPVDDGGTADVAVVDEMGMNEVDVADADVVDTTDVNEVDTAEINVVDTTDVNEVDTAEVSVVDATDVNEVNTTEINIVDTTDVDASGGDNGTATPVVNTESSGTGNTLVDDGSGGGSSGGGTASISLIVMLVSLLFVRRRAAVAVGSFRH